MLAAHIVDRDDLHPAPSTGWGFGIITRFGSFAGSYAMIKAFGNLECSFALLGSHENRHATE
jgi:hypothetical protein